MNTFVFAKINNERVFVGTFSSIETIYDEVESKLIELGHDDWIGAHPIYMMGTKSEPYRMLWAKKEPSQNKSGKVDDEVDY